MKEISFKNADGNLNGKLIAGIISLLIVLIQQIFAVFGVKFTGDWSAIVAVINTALTILGMLGVITDVQTVTAPTVENDEESQVEATAIIRLLTKRRQNPPHKQVNSSIIKY